MRQIQIIFCLTIFVAIRYWFPLQPYTSTTVVGYYVETLNTSNGSEMLLNVRPRATVVGYYVKTLNLSNGSVMLLNVRPRVLSKPLQFIGHTNKLTDNIQLCSHKPMARVVSTRFFNLNIISVYMVVRRTEKRSGYYFLVSTAINSKLIMECKRTCVLLRRWNINTGKSLE